MDKLPLKLFMAVNVFLIRISRGHLGTQLGSQTILLLHTTGRRTGKRHATPIAYFFTEGIYFLVASNWGKDRNAGWYYNLLENPRTTIEVQGVSKQIESRPAEGAAYDNLWRFAVDHHPAYLHYKEMTTRHIPIVVLTPVVS